jgi:tRNA(fMet)-specific endonuclease VapC
MSQALRYVLDTDMCIYLLNGNETVKAKLAEAGLEAVSVAMPTVGELYFGAYNSSHVEANLARVRGFFEPPCPQLLAIDDAAMQCFGRFKAELRRKAQPVGDLDLQIAGVVVSRGLTLVTNNTRHFERIPDLPLDNWLAEPSGT